MRIVPSILLATLTLIGCESMKPSDPNWDRNCQRNYSENSYEFAACKSRVEKNVSFTKEAGTLGITPDNVNRPTTDETRKSRDVGN